MKYILKYQNFNESKGISDSCETVLYKIWNLIEDDINNKYSNQIYFDVDEQDFKCKNVLLKLNFNKGQQNRCNATSVPKNLKIENNYLINSEINLNIIYKEIDDEFIYYIKSVLFHELLHIFQYYNILSNDKFRPESFSIGSIIPQLREIVNTKYVNYLLDILYYSLSHELSAQLHQYYFYKLKHKDYKKLIEIKDMLSNFVIKTLTEDESKEINLIKNHIINSIKFFTNNKKYLKNVNKSLWIDIDNISFLNKLKVIIDSKLEWLNKKIKLIDSKYEDSKNITYHETIISLPHDFEMYDIDKRQDFIKENLNNCQIIDFI
jgi:hypothetical protein